MIYQQRLLGKYLAFKIVHIPEIICIATSSKIPLDLAVQSGYGQWQTWPEPLAFGVC